MNYNKLYIFHPSILMVQKIDDLILENVPEIEYEKIIEEDLLKEAMEFGITDSIKNKIKEIISSIPEDNNLILCSCSTLGGIAEEMNEFTNNKVIRIDRPMAEEAIKIGMKIGVAAALESTLLPTKKLLVDVANKENKKIEIEFILCKSAWKYFEQGNKEEYINIISKELEKVYKKYDVIVLAQGSMAPVSKKLKNLGVPILSSPELAIKRVFKLLTQC